MHVQACAHFQGQWKLSMFKCVPQGTVLCSSGTAFKRVLACVSMRACLRIFCLTVGTSLAVVCGRWLFSTLLCAAESYVVGSMSYRVRVDAFRRSLCLAEHLSNTFSHTSLNNHEKRFLLFLLFLSILAKANRIRNWSKLRLV